MIRTRTWVLCIGGALLAAICSALLLSRQASGGTIANIYLDGTCIRSVNISLVTESELFSVGGSECTNVVEIAPGKVRVREADCPDQVCVNQGWITTSGAPIVCLPNRLVIRIEKSPAADDIPDAVVK